MDINNILGANALFSLMEYNIGIDILTNQPVIK